ncbi:MAG: hypothetical protein WC943_14245 [Elusimicrobiota bacterium]
MIAIDSPLPHERILFKDCAIVVRAGMEGPVEVSIDDGPWRLARHWMGYWWLRWRNNRPGRHHVVARLRMASAGFARSNIRWFRVIPSLMSVDASPPAPRGRGPAARRD